MCPFLKFLVGKEELQELRNGKEELEKSFANERSVAHNLIREKGRYFLLEILQVIGWLA